MDSFCHNNLKQLSDIIKDRINTTSGIYIYVVTTFVRKGIIPEKAHIIVTLGL